MMLYPAVTGYCRYTVADLKPRTKVLCPSPEILKMHHDTMQHLVLVQILHTSPALRTGKMLVSSLLSPPSPKIWPELVFQFPFLKI